MRFIGFWPVVSFQTIFHVLQSNYQLMGLYYRDQLKPVMKLQYLCFLFIAVIFLFSCEKKKDILYEYSAPVDIGDGPEVSTLYDAGLDENKFIKMMEAAIADSLHRIHSILVIKNNKLVFEEYFKGYALNHDQLVQIAN